MIGGKDIIIPTSGSPAAIEAVLLLISSHWPDAVIEDAEIGEMLKNFPAKATKHIHEILIYKDPISANQWRELGADESLVGTMVHILVALDQITIVVDSKPSAEIQSLIISIRRLLSPSSGLPGSQGAYIVSV